MQIEAINAVNRILISLMGSQRYICRGNRQQKSRLQIPDMIIRMCQKTPQLHERLNKWLKAEI